MEILPILSIYKKKWIMYSLNKASWNIKYTDVGAILTAQLSSCGIYLSPLGTQRLSRQLLKEKKRLELRIEFLSFIISLLYIFLFLKYLPVSSITQSRLKWMTALCFVYLWSTVITMECLALCLYIIPFILTSHNHFSFFFNLPACNSCFNKNFHIKGQQFVARMQAVKCYTMFFKVLEEHENWHLFKL